MEVVNCKITSEDDDKFMEVVNYDITDEDKLMEDNHEYKLVEDNQNFVKKQKTENSIDHNGPNKIDHNGPNKIDHNGPNNIGDDKKSSNIDPKLKQKKDLTLDEKRSSTRNENVIGPSYVVTVFNLVLVNVALVIFGGARAENVFISVLFISMLEMLETFGGKCFARFKTIFTTKSKIIEMVEENFKT